MLLTHVSRFQLQLIMATTDPNKSRQVTVMETEVEVEKIVEVPVDRIVYQDKVIYQDRESAVEVESLVYMEKVGKGDLRVFFAFV
jgi:hypothetical protein